MKKPHKHAAIIHAYADGAQVEYLNDSGEWCSAKYPDFDPEIEYRIKPEAPKTTLSSEELLDLWKSSDAKNLVESLEIVASAAIARAIDDKQAFTAEAVKQALDAGTGCDMVPAAMLEKVAMRVQRRCIEEAEYFTNGVQLGRNIGRVDLAAIIASVREGKADSPVQLNGDDMTIKFDMVRYDEFKIHFYWQGKELFWHDTTDGAVRVNGTLEGRLVR